MPRPGPGAINIGESSVSPYRFIVITNTEDHFYVSEMFAAGGFLYRLVCGAFSIQ